VGDGSAIADKLRDRRHISAIGRVVRKRPAEIDLCLDDLAAADGQPLRIAESSTAKSRCFVNDEDLFAVHNDIDELKVRDRLAVGPTTREVSAAIQAVIQRAGEMEVFVDQGLDGDSVLMYIGEITRTGDVGRILLHIRRLH